VRAEQAAELVARHGLEAEVFLTERPGHARELARAALARGARTVVAWGGDGTVNEVGSALVHTDAAMAIVPAGSGNGLARELGIPCDPARAIEIALRGTDRTMDAGELDGHLFFNIAGLGLDANIAQGFAETGTRTRGFRRYAAVTLRELMRYEPEEYEIAVDGERSRVRAMLVAIAARSKACLASIPAWARASRSPAPARCCTTWTESLIEAGRRLLPACIPGRCGYGCRVPSADNVSHL
jgi:diacylglycerol kinase family enzyme